MGLMDKIKGAAGVGTASLEVEIRYKPVKRGEELVAVLRVIGGTQPFRLNFLIADVRWIGKWSAWLSDGRMLNMEGEAIFHRANVPGSEGIMIEAAKTMEFPLTVKIPVDAPLISADLRFDFGVRADIEGTADPTFHTPLEITA